MRGPCCYQAMSKLIIVKSMVGIILCLFHVQPEDGHYQVPKHVVVPYYVENALYSANKYSCVRRVLTLYISYFIEHNGDDEPYDYTIFVISCVRNSHNPCNLNFSVSQGNLVPFTSKLFRFYGILLHI